LVGKLVAAGAEQVFSSSYFHEAVIRTNVENAKILRSLTGQGIVGGYDLSKDYPELSNAILVCATETKTEAALDRYAEQLGRIVSKLSEPPPCARK
jgi:glycine dehydrogenase subunit 1